MKFACTVLVTALALLFALVGTVPAGITPPGGSITPAGGSNDGEDGDHPWGGDRIIGNPSGTTATKIVRQAVLTGYASVDLVIFYTLERLKRQGQTGGSGQQTTVGSLRTAGTVTVSKGVSR